MLGLLSKAAASSGGQSVPGEEQTTRDGRRNLMDV